MKKLGGGASFGATRGLIDSSTRLCVLHLGVYYIPPPPPSSSFPVVIIVNKTTRLGKVRRYSKRQEGGRGRSLVRTSPRETNTIAHHVHIMSVSVLGADIDYRMRAETVQKTSMEQCVLIATNRELPSTGRLAGSARKVTYRVTTLQSPSPVSGPHQPITCLQIRIAVEGAGVDLARLQHLHSLHAGGDTRPHPGP